MTHAFLIVVRIAMAVLIAFWAYRLWTGTRSWASRGVGMFFSAALLWQIIGWSI